MTLLWDHLSSHFGIFIFKSVGFRKTSALIWAIRKRQSVRTRMSEWVLISFWLRHNPTTALDVSRKVRQTRLRISEQLSTIYAKMWRSEISQEVTYGCPAVLWLDVKMTWHRWETDTGRPIASPIFSTNHSSEVCMFWKPFDWTI